MGRYEDKCKRDWYEDDKYECDKQKHVHEFLGSTEVAEEKEECHSHRFAGITGEAIPVGCGRHVHKYCTTTDFEDKHYHKVMGTTGPDIKVSPCEHVHYEESKTSCVECHRHDYDFATLIGPNPPRY